MSADISILCLTAKRKNKATLPSYPRVQPKLSGDPETTWLDTDEYCTFRGISPSKAEKDRMNGEGPPFYRFKRSVRYKLADILDYLKKHQKYINTAGGVAAPDRK